MCTRRSRRTRLLWLPPQLKEGNHRSSASNTQTGGRSSPTVDNSSISSNDRFARMPRNNLPTRRSICGSNVRQRTQLIQEMSVDRVFITGSQVRGATNQRLGLTYSIFSFDVMTVIMHGMIVD